MAVVNVGTVITKALTKLTGGLPRAQFVTWFNEVVTDIVTQPRKWHFLEEYVSLPIVNNKITIPAGMSEVTQIVVGDTYFTQKNQITDEQAAKIDMAFNQADSLPDDLEDFTPMLDNPYFGYTLDSAGVITFHPVVTGTADVTGEIDTTTDYADLSDTIFPLAFQNVFISGLRMHYYDSDKDGRFTKENTQYQLDLNKIKAWDNRRKPMMQWSRRYIR